MGIEEEIKQKVLSLGFDLAGITSADDINSEQIENFRQWINAGCNGQMDYLSKNIGKRFSPVSVLPDAKSVICAAINYKIKQSAANDSLQIASYTLYPDYHKFIKEKLFAVADFLKSMDKNLKFKICVDSSAIAEKILAMRAGLGFIGKNHLLTNEKLGSFLLLGEIVTNIQLKSDRAIDSQLCGNCSKCIDACPTGALTVDGLNAARCISYLTIEHKSRIIPELKNKIGSHLFGCEECLRACPYNDKSPLCEKSQYGFTAHEVNLIADEIVGWSKKEFENFTSNSVMKRTGFRRMKRNALICKKNAK